MTDSVQPGLDRLLHAPSAAVLAVYGADGSFVMTPVWFRAFEEYVDVVVAEGDPKLDRLREDPRCVFLAFETVAPFAGFHIRAEVALVTEGVQEARLEIAGRYLGRGGAERWTAQRTKPGVIVRLPLVGARTWDLSAILPD